MCGNQNGQDGALKKCNIYTYTRPTISREAAMSQNSAFSENESSTFLKVCINTEIDRYYEIFGGMAKLVTRDVSPTPGRPPPPTP